MAYWPPFSHGNKPVDLAHLEPFDFSVTAPSKAARRVFVTFSSHVFTRGAEQPDPQDLICFDGRVFCQERYELSRGLPSIIAGFPTARVLQTWEKRNYVYLATVTRTPADGPYHVFFSLKKRVNPSGVNLMVESAYRRSPSSYTPPRRPNAVRFGLLVDKVFLGQPLTFR